MDQEILLRYWRAGTLRSMQAHTPRDGRVQVCNCCDPVTVPRRRSVAPSSILVEEIDPGGDTLRNPRPGAAGDSRCVQAVATLSGRIHTYG